MTDRRVLRVLAVTLLAFVGIFLPFTYMSAVFAPAACFLAWGSTPPTSKRGERPAKEISKSAAAAM
jgi:hypothetical protein